MMFISLCFSKFYLLIVMTYSQLRIYCNICFKKLNPLYKFILVTFFKLITLFVLSVSANAESISKPDVKTNSTKKIFTSPSDKFIDEILSDTPSSEQTILEEEDIIPDVAKTEPPKASNKKKLPNDTTPSEDFVEDPEALLDEITNQVEDNTLLSDDTQNSSEATGHLNTPSEKREISDIPSDIKPTTKPKTKLKNDSEQDFFSVIDSTDTLKTPKKELILEEEPDNNGIDASTTPTAIDNDILLEAIDNNDMPTGNQEPEFSSDITDKSLRQFSNPLKESSRQPLSKDTRFDDDSKLSPSDNFADDMFQLPDNVDKISDVSDAQTQKTGIIPNDTDISDIYKPFEQDNSKAKDKKQKKQSPSKPTNMVFDNQNFICQFEETIDSANQEQSYKLTLIPQDEPKTPIVLISKSKMELHQFFDADTESNSRSQIEFSILQHFCSKIIVQKSVSEAY